jgi:hypothetical protein
MYHIACASLEEKNAKEYQYGGQKNLWGVSAIQEKCYDFNY